MQLQSTTIEAARERCAQRPEWLRAVNRAAVLLPASTVEALDAGRLRIVSARSGGAYVASPAGCTCEGAQHGRICWHRAAARLVEVEARALRCRYCGGRMVESTTIAGEPSLTCERCGHEVAAATAAESCEASR